MPDHPQPPDTPGEEVDPGNSAAQLLVEGPILDAVGKKIGIDLERNVSLALGDSEVCPDGASSDRAVFVEVFAHVGKMKSGQRHKVSTDALKLLAIRDAYPNARLILAFADQTAAKSVSGWRAATLRANGIEVHVVDLDPTERAKVEAAQVRQTR